jgi:menaquinol-cytochrome c reductase iron-sulfur subunit
MEEQKPIEEQKAISRRRFLEIATWSIGGVISLGVTLPAISYVVGPSLEKKDVQEWIRIGSASKVEIGIPTLFKMKIKRQVGWNVTEEELAMYLVTENGRDYVAISNVCTHLGCRVRWITENEQFFCPCHNAVFDKAGSVIAGPPPKPLNQYQVKLENDQLFILGG